MHRYPRQYFVVNWDAIPLKALFESDQIEEERV